MAKEALRYLKNAREILNKSPIEDNIYTDRKYVKSACGLAYLGVLKAIDEYLLKRGLTKKELPEKVEEYEKALKKYLSVHDGRLLRDFDAIYDQLHIAGYYRGLLHNVNTVKGTLKMAEEFIKKIG
jgi:hypothetical protein